MLHPAWNLLATPILPEGFIEDFVLFREPHGAFRAVYCKSLTSFQDQRLYTRTAESPEGPFGPEELGQDGPTTHTRLYRGEIALTGTPSSRSRGVHVLRGDILAITKDASSKESSKGKNHEIA